MCENCEKLKEKLIRYRRLLQSIYDERTYQDIKQLIVEGEAQLATAHQKENGEARPLES